MKKTLTILITAAILLSLCGCSQVELPPLPTAAASTPEAVHETPSHTPEAVHETPAPTPESVQETPAPAPEATPDAASSAWSPEVSFSTTAMDGSTVDDSFFAEHKLTMINFFEPWCGPCAQELPDLQALCEALGGEGFAILGVFQTEDGVAELLESKGVSYPVIRYVREFDAYQTGYVPTTIFVDSEGKIVGETIIGSQDYDIWLAIIKELLG